MLSPRVYADRREKREDLVLGALGWILVNGLFLLLMGIVSEQMATVDGDPNAAPTVGNVALFANLAALLLLGYFRRFLALGMLAAMAGLLAIGVVVGVIATAVCLISQVGR